MQTSTYSPISIYNFCYLHINKLIHLARIAIELPLHFWVHWLWNSLQIKWICPTAPTRPVAAFGGFPCTACGFLNSIYDLVQSLQPCFHKLIGCFLWCHLVADSETKIGFFFIWARTDSLFSSLKLKQGLIWRRLHWMAVMIPKDLMLQQRMSPTYCPPSHLMVLIRGLHNSSET